ncbi:MAG: protein translocase subunit SecD [Actinomycetota bacterium]
MAKSQRRRNWTSILVMVAIVGGIWTAIALGCSEKTDAKGKQTCESPMSAQLGLDLQGGISVVLAPRGEAKTDALDKAVDIIRQRVDALGVAEPDISRQGDNILIEIPGIKDRSAALDAIGRTAELRMRPVLQEIPPGSPEWAKAKPADCLKPIPAGKDGKPGLEDAKAPISLCARQQDAKGRDAPVNQWAKLSLGPAELVGSDIAGALAQLAGGGGLQSGGWEVNLKLSSEGAKKFKAVTGKLACNQEGDVKRQLAIALDGVVESHPQMGTEVKCNEGIDGGSAVITGNFTEKDAKDLALVLRFGALPVALEAQETNEISPTLGKESLRGGLLAGIIGVSITLIYVVLFYRALGFLIWFGLGLHAAFTFGVVIILGKTAGFALSLAGIAGLIVSIGIAADSFIVYFERLKDEVHTGKSVRASVDRAWSSAWRTIVAADLVTALAATALYVLAVGSVRGFALMLGLSTALDLFISYLVMHPMVWLLAQTKFFNSSRRLGIRGVAGETAPALQGAAR